MRRTIHLISHSESCEEWEREWICSLLADFEIVHVSDPEGRACLPNAILMVSSSAAGPHDEVIERQLHQHRRANMSAGLIHLSDEWCNATVGYYPLADFVFRNYERPSVQKPEHCHYFALGWKGGFRDTLVDRAIGQRRYRWSFAGQVKTSRQSMLDAARRIKGGREVLASGFGGLGGLSTHEYASLLNDTVFALCPRGNHSLDCFRVYEALEAGAIPIVEDEGGTDLLGEWLWPGNFLRIGGWRRSYWRHHFRNPLRGSFWKRVYGSDFPCPRIINWATLNQLIQSIDIQQTSIAVRSWWARYKASVRLLMRETIEKSFA